MAEPAPRVRVYPATSQNVTGAVLVLPGGRSASHARAHRAQLAYQRMRPFATALHRAGAARGIEVGLLRYRYRGWNEPDRNPVVDARWALGRYPDVPVALVGHSMGGRTAFRVADDARVVAVCALAPWVQGGEPVTHLAGRAVVIAHGDRDRWTDARASYEYALRARHVTGRVARFDVHGDGHAMLRHAGQWTELVCHTALGALGIEPQALDLTKYFRQPAPGGLRVPLAGALS